MRETCRTDGALTNEHRFFMAKSYPQLPPGGFMKKMDEKYRVIRNDCRGF